MSEPCAYCGNPLLRSSPGGGVNRRKGIKATNGRTYHRKCFLELNKQGKNLRQK